MKKIKAPYRRTSVQQLPSGKWAELSFSGAVIVYRGLRMEADTQAEVEKLRLKRLARQRDAQDTARIALNWAWLNRFNPGSANALINAPKLATA